jgi:hypothetical protein
MNDDLIDVGSQQQRQSPFLIDDADCNNSNSNSNSSASSSGGLNTFAVPKSSFFDRVATLLPAMQQANEELEANIRRHGGEAYNIEHIEDDGDSSDSDSNDEDSDDAQSGETRRRAQVIQFDIMPIGKLDQVDADARRVLDVLAASNGAGILDDAVDDDDNDDDEYIKEGGSLRHQMVADDAVLSSRGAEKPLIELIDERKIASSRQTAPTGLMCVSAANERQQENNNDATDDD